MPNIRGPETSLKLLRIWATLLFFISIMLFNLIAGGWKRSQLETTLTQEKFAKCAPTYTNEILLSSFSWLGLGIAIYALTFLSVTSILYLRGTVLVSHFFHGIVFAITIIILAIISQSVTVYALLPTSRVGNFLSDYATHI